MACAGGKILHGNTGKKEVEIALALVVEHVTSLIYKLGECEQERGNILEK